MELLALDNFKCARMCDKGSKVPMVSLCGGFACAPDQKSRTYGQGYRLQYCT